MSKSSQINRIIQESASQIAAGETTLEAVLASHPDLAHELRPQLEAAMWLQRAKASVEPRPAFIASSKRRLLAQIEVEHAPSPWQRILRYVPTQKLAVQLVSFFLLFISLSAVGNNLRLASHLALPGSALYPLKLNLERLHLAFTLDQAADARLMIEFSQRRTSEIVELVLEGDYDYIPRTAALLEASIDGTLNTLDDIAVGDPQQAAALSSTFYETLSNEAFILRIMEETSPPSAHPGIRLALDITNAGLSSISE